MIRVCVEFEIELPDNLTEAEIEEWLRFVLGENGQMKVRNPLSSTRLEAQRVRFTKEKAGAQ